MKMPRSFSDVRASVLKMRTGSPAINVNPRASLAKMVPGVRATPAQGTSSAANTPDPLNPGRSVVGARIDGDWDNPNETPPIAIFSTDAPAFDQTEHTVVQNRDWPQNVSREIGSEGPGRSHQITTDEIIQIEEPPGRIVRYLPERVFGIADGMITGRYGGAGGFPWNGDWGHITHVPIARQALGTKGPQAGLADDDAAIPAVYAGNPR